MNYRVDELAALVGGMAGAAKQAKKRLFEGELALVGGWLDTIIESYERDNRIQAARIARLTAALDETRCRHGRDKTDCYRCEQDREEAIDERRDRDERGVVGVGAA